jgi:hypothetical protein
VAISASSKYDIFYYLHQRDLYLQEGLFLHITPLVCRRGKFRHALNIIPKKRTLKEVSYVRSDVQNLKSVIVYECDDASKISAAKCGMKDKLYICYSNFKWHKIC